MTWQNDDELLKLLLTPLSEILSADSELLAQLGCNHKRLVYLGDLVEKGQADLARPEGFDPDDWGHVGYNNLPNFNRITEILKQHNLVPKMRLPDDWKQRRAEAPPLAEVIKMKPRRK